MSDLFEGAKVGDEVCQKMRYGFRSDLFTLSIGKIEKVTATQITALGSKWRRSDGLLISSGDKWRRPYIQPVTPEILAEWAEVKAIIAAEKACEHAAEKLRRAKGEAAVMLAALLPPELKGQAND